MEPGFQPVDPAETKEPPSRKKGRRQIPFRLIAPNLVTLLGLCAGLSAIRMAIEGRMELAVILIVIAAALDGIDGRVARFLKGSSKFGAELDSLADFVNFGVAPAVMLFMWELPDFRSIGWIASLIFAICVALRLARFNAALDDPDKPAWHKEFFTGIPAPAGAIVGILPIYLSFLGMPLNDTVQTFVLIYILLIALLMVSNVPTYSGKTFGKSLRSDLVLPGIIVFVTLVVLLVTWPWSFLTVGSVIYLCVIPISWQAFKKKAARETDTEET